MNATAKTTTAPADVLAALGAATAKPAKAAKVAPVTLSDIGRKAASVRDRIAVVAPSMNPTEEHAAAVLTAHVGWTAENLRRHAAAILAAADGLAAADVRVSSKDGDTALTTTVVVGWTDTAGVERHTAVNLSGGAAAPVLAPFARRAE